MTIMTAGYSARSLPFHGLPKSKIVKDAPTVEDAIHLAGLDFEVTLQPVYQTRRDGSVVEVPGKFLSTRDDTEFPLGVVGSAYVPFQAAEAFDFANALLGDGVEFDAAGSWNQDRNFFLTAKLPEGINIDGIDPIDFYLLFTASHDGSGAIKAMITPQRLACTNQLALATRRAVSRWSCKHTRTASQRTDEAARTLRIVDTYAKEFEAITAQLRSTEMSLGSFRHFVEELVPVSETITTNRNPRAWEGMIDTFQTSPTVDRNNAYGALNAVSEFYQHLRGGRGDAESRFDSLNGGQIYQTVNRAAELLLRRNA